MYSPSHSIRWLASMVERSMRRTVLSLVAYSASTGRAGSGSPPMARAAMRSAARRYFSIRIGEIVRTSPRLSKPWPESSLGKSRSAWKSTASRSRIVFEYSLRLSRWAVTRPGSGLTLRSALSNAEVRKPRNLSTSTCGGRGIPLGGISPARTFLTILSQVSRPSTSELAEANGARLRLPEATRSLWQPEQLRVSTPLTA